MSETSRRRLLLGMATGHLILVALGAASVDLRPFGYFGKVLDYYSNLSGASSGYGFFASGVGGQLRARFDVIDHEGHQSSATLEPTSSQEAALRVGHIIHEFWDGDEDPGMRRSLAASLAGKVFARNPQARKVVVRVESFDPVSMEAFRRGSRPQWSPLYQAQFVRQSRQTAD
jgi:hypothetical protein